ncbi:gamma-glutamyltransferase [Rhodospirillaceae bacterium SYSU D60014]|uniref:gamma-glutamyltransferase n=1 Tax=Virgifigura deserti TaxID=2268457 RepID=UPI0013C43FC5
MVLLAGCESAPPPGAIGSVEGFAGAIAADEPRAVLIARDTLSAGGTAADAAVALYFALSVTLPSTAGLGGGGVCLIHDPTDVQPEGGQTVALDFLPRPAPNSSTYGGSVALPGNVRGMAALHARYGRLRWEQLLSPAENLARFGTPVSRALAREVATAGDKLLHDSEVRRIFTGPNGSLITEGDRFRQVELAAVLAQIRLKGAGAFYTDQLALRLSEAAQSIGAPLPLEALRGAVPEFRDTVRVAFDDHLLHVAPPPAAGGAVTAALVLMLTRGREINEVPAEERAHLFAEASARAFIDRDRWMAPDGGIDEAAATPVSVERAEALMQGYEADAATAGAQQGKGSPPENPWATGFVVVDKDGGAVACNVTMNDLFGSGRMAPGTGIILAPAPSERPGSIALGPAIMANAQTGRLFYAAGASGGPTASTAMANLFLRVAVEDQPLEAAIEAKRLHHNGFPDIVFHEAGESDETLSALRRRNHSVREAGILGRVNAIWCPGGLPTRPETCQAQSDPRANGLATILAE